MTLVASPDVTVSDANRAAYFKSPYRKRATQPCSCPQISNSRFRYSTKTLDKFLALATRQRRGYGLSGLSQR